MSNQDTYLSKILKYKRDLLLQIKKESTFGELKKIVRDLPEAMENGPAAIPL